MTEVMPTVSYKEVLWDECSDISENIPSRQGKHGRESIRVDHIILFAHKAHKAYRIPDNFFPIGYAHKKKNCVSFMPSQRAVFLHKDRFKIYDFDVPQMNRKTIQIVTSNSVSETDRNAYISLIKDVYKKTSPLFPPVHAEDKNYWFFVPYDALGHMLTPSERTYAAEGRNLTTLERPAEYIRMHELSLHRTAHHFNRYNSSQTNISRSLEFPRTSFEEAVASWVETAYLQNHYARKSRALGVLYHRHLTASQRIMPPQKLAQEYPGNAGLLSLDHINHEYIHYTFAPLMMIALDVMLRENNTGYTLRTLLTEFHAGTEENFMDTIRHVLPNKAFKTFQSWNFGETIPKKIIRRGVELYKEGNG